MRYSIAILPWILLLSFGTLTACSESGGGKPASQAKDVLLTAEIKSKLAAIDIDTTSNVSVSVNGETVTLRGVVRKASEIDRLGDAAAGVQGVTSVKNLITSDAKTRGVSEKLGDVSLETEVAVSLAAQTGVNALGVKAHARDGVVTLQGHVPSEAIKSVMWSAAKKTHGVKRIVDEIEVGK